MSSIWVWIWVEHEFTGSCKTLNLVCRVGTAFLWSGSAGGCSCCGGYKRAAEEFQFKNAISIWEEFLVSSHNDWVSLMWTFELEKKVAHKSRVICLVYGCEGSSMLRKLKVMLAVEVWSSSAIYRRRQSPSSQVISQSTAKTHRAVHINSFNSSLLNSYCPHYLNTHTNTHSYEQTLISLNFMF